MKKKQIMFPWGPLSRVLSRTGKLVGHPTGGKYRCQMEGCNGNRIGVRWSDGSVTYPCSKGLIFSRSGRSAKLG